VSVRAWFHALHPPKKRYASVGRVARAVGYASAFAFSNAFKRRTGTSPSEYRVRASA
jgi:AraC-like DNA-binding protein